LQKHLEPDISIQIDRRPNDIPLFYSITEKTLVLYAYTKSYDR
jgi:hypothetical protein